MSNKEEVPFCVGKISWILTHKHTHTEREREPRNLSSSSGTHVANSGLAEQIPFSTTHVPSCSPSSPMSSCVHKVLGWLCKRYWSVEVPRWSRDGDDRGTDFGTAGGAAVSN